MLRVRIMGAQTVRAAYDTAIVGFSLEGISFRCRRCACDVSGAAFNYVASLNRYVYLFIYLKCQAMYFHLK